jgi:hypothetical protein
MALNVIRCWRCGSATGAGKLNWRFRRHDCASAHETAVREAARTRAAQGEAARLLALQADVRELGSVVNRRRPAPRHGPSRETTSTCDDPTGVLI